MKTKQWIWISTSLLLLISCGSDKKMDNPTLQPEATAYPISCSVVQPSGMQETRALIDGNTSDERSAALQAACTPGTGGEAIAIYGSYTPDNGGTTQEVFSNTTLVYDASVGTNDETNNISWNYANEQYWMKECTYTFRACYPQGTLSGTSASLSGTYNTLTTQKDLMVASTTVNTATYNLSQPVELQMNHALAAVCFKVKTEDGSTMTLKSLNLSGLYTQGDFTHSSTVTPTANDWTQLADNVSSYGWEGTLEFNSERDVTAYTIPTTLGTYADDGFILVIPQKNANPILNLTTNLKEYIGIDLREKDGNGNRINTNLMPGMKYTYVITVSPTQLKLTLSIKEWNKRESSYDINF